MECSDAHSSCGTQSSADHLTTAEEDATLYESTDPSNSQFSNALSAALRQFNGSEVPRSSTTSAGSSSDFGGFPVVEAGEDAASQETVCPLGEITTVMVKNVPVKCGQRRLLRQFLGAGFQGKLDFIYLPMDPRSRSSRGFAFVNLTTVESAHQFYRIFHGKFLKNYPSELPLEVAVAEIQGFDANAEHYLLVKASRKGKGRDVFGCPTFLRPLQRHLMNHLRTLEEPKKPKSKSSDREEASLGSGQDGQDTFPLQQWENRMPSQLPLQTLATPHPASQSLYSQMAAQEAANAAAMRAVSGYLPTPEHISPCQQIIPPQAAGFAEGDPMRCHQCGRRIEHSRGFCPFCGEQQLPATCVPGQSFWI